MWPLASIRESPAQTFSDQGSTILGGANFDSRSASLADFDDDGDLDLFFQGGGGGAGARQLYRNNLVESGTLGFTNVSSLLPSGLGPSWSAAWADYDGDGRVDVFVGQSNIGGSGDVLRNNGPAGFSNESVATGLNHEGFHQNVAWSDIDNDKDLDLIITMEGPEFKHEVFVQRPDGTFNDVGQQVGFQVPPGDHGYGMAIGDTDGDGDMDIYISTCQPGGNIRNHFYQNMLVENGVLGFVDIADSNGTQYFPNSYGAAFHDFDDDGRLDLYMVGADGNPSKMWRNDGNNQFTDVDTLLGHQVLSDNSGDLNGATAVDYDNDGDLDWFIHSHLPGGGTNQARKLYRNDGDWQFTDVTVSEGVHTVNEGAYDSTWGDIDRDGDQDLIAPTDSGHFERVFISNASTNGNSWLYVELEGPSYNTTGIGAALYATIHDDTPEERTLRREANTNAGTFNQSDLPVHFGLGDATLVDELRIEWADGTVQHLFDVAVDQYLTVEFTSPLAGDYNADGVVDAADYTVWKDLVGSNVHMPNEVVTPGQVTEEDYDEWAANFGNSASGSIASEPVPEPDGWLLLLAAVTLSLSAGGVRRRCN